MTTTPEDRAQIGRALSALVGLDVPPEPLPERELLAFALRRLRLERGMSYRQVGERLGLHGSNVCRAEHGTRRPPTAAELAIVFGISQAAALAPCGRCGYRPPAGYQCLACGTPGGAA
jgi:hypothetical protein